MKYIYIYIFFLLQIAFIIDFLILVYNMHLGISNPQLRIYTEFGDFWVMKTEPDKKTTNWGNDKSYKKYFFLEWGFLSIMFVCFVFYVVYRCVMRDMESAPSILAVLIYY